MKNKTKQTKGIKHMLMPSVEFHVLCVEVGLDLGCHVVIGVVLGFTTQTQYQVQISFLLDFVVHFCTCSQTVFCDRQFLPVANYCTLLHRENGSFEVLSLQLGRDNPSGVLSSGTLGNMEGEKTPVGGFPRSAHSVLPKVLRS